MDQSEDNILDTIYQSSKTVNSEYNIPSQCQHSIIISIAKKGSALSLDNQRGIVKLCAMSMIQDKILLQRIQSVTESMLVLVPFVCLKIEKNRILIITQNIIKVERDRPIIKIW